MLVIAAVCGRIVVPWAGVHARTLPQRKQALAAGAPFGVRGAGEMEAYHLPDNQVAPMRRPCETCPVPATYAVSLRRQLERMQ